MKLTKGGPKLPLGNGRQAASGLTQFGAADEAPTTFVVPRDKVHPNPDQPRRSFSEAALNELAASIETHGLLQPILVTQHPQIDGAYIIVAGERRWRACGIAGKANIQAILVSGNIDEIALIENIQRQDLSPIEEARALQRLQDLHGYDQGRLAAAVGKPRDDVNSTLRILSLPAEFLDDEAISDISKNTLLQIARIEREDLQRQAWTLAKDGRLTVRMAKDLVRQSKEPVRPTDMAPQIIDNGPVARPDIATVDGGTDTTGEQNVVDLHLVEPAIVATSEGPGAGSDDDETFVAGHTRAKKPTIHVTFFRQLEALGNTLDKGALNKGAFTDEERARLEEMRQTLNKLLD